MEESKVSVIVPVYNAEKTIQRSLESVLYGGYSNFEIIVVDDGSTDKTAEIVQSFATKDDRVKYIFQVNSGVGVARCKGIKESTGEYIAFCDSDDWFHSDFLQEHIKHLKKFNADISMCPTFSDSINFKCSDVVILKEKPDILSDYLNYKGMSVSLWDKVFKRELLDNDEIDNDFRYSEDLYMNYVACKRANRTVYFKTTCYYWFNKPNSLSRGQFNPIKLECDFSSWNKIIEDCKLNFKHLETTARLSSELWLCGTYRLMVSRHYHNKEQEKRIAKYVRQDGIKVLKAEKNKRNKVFLVISYFSFPLARMVWYILNGSKKVIKKFLKNK